MNNTPIQFELGQTVRWPQAPDGIAQIVELRRKNVMIFYRTRRRRKRDGSYAGGKIRHPIVRPDVLAAKQHQAEPFLPLINPFHRVILKRKVKAYA